MNPLAPLLDLLDQIDEIDEDEATLDLTAATSSGHSELDIEIGLMRRGVVHSRWIVTAQGMVESQLRMGSHEFLSVESPHPLLLDHLDKQAQLYLNAAPSAPHVVLAGLWIEHRQVMGGWRPFERYLNTLIEPVQLLAHGFGVLATGPNSLIERYAQVLVVNDCAANVLDRGPAKRWDLERQWVEEDRQLQVLVLPCSTLLPADNFDQSHSWVVAEDFAVTRSPRV